jgi:ABC-type multidrug transport system fused ATPase/permease subunit
VDQGGIGAGQWLSFAPNIAQATAAANRILSMRKREKRKGQSLPVAEYEHAEYVNHSKGGEVDEKGVELEFSNVWFRYPTRDVPVLNGLNLTVRSHLSISDQDDYQETDNGIDQKGTIRSYRRGFG